MLRLDFVTLELCNSEAKLVLFSPCLPNLRSNIPKPEENKLHHLKIWASRVKGMSDTYLCYFLCQLSQLVGEIAVLARESGKSFTFINNSWSIS